MAQNPFTLSFKLGHPNKEKLCIVYLRYHSATLDIKLPTEVRIKKRNWVNHKVSSHVNADVMNNKLKTFRNEVEARALTPGAIISRDFLLGKRSSSDRLIDFFEDYTRLMDGKLSPGRIRHYNVVKNRVSDFDGTITFAGINLEWMQRFEAFIRPGLANNTVNSNMKLICLKISFRYW